MTSKIYKKLFKNYYFKTLCVCSKSETGVSVPEASKPKTYIFSLLLSILCFPPAQADCGGPL